MKAANRILVVIGAFTLSLNVAAQSQEPLSVLEALPSTNVLGAGWSRNISLLFDAASKPAEIIGATARLPDSFRKEKRDAVENPTNRISGWAHAHFDLQATNRTARYEVQVQRYRRQQELTKDFDGLMALNAEEYQKKELEGVGEVAVVYRQASGMTLWFRRGTFLVWISPMNSISAWENDPGLQQLTRVFDKRLDTLLLDKKAQPEPRGGKEN